MKSVKIPISVLVVIHDGQGQVLLIERADKPGFWQSVTGSLDDESEAPMVAAQRELLEETGFVCPSESWLDWRQTQRYEIFAHWRHRYAPGVTHNTEHVFSVQIKPGAQPVLSAREHLRFEWLPWQRAAERCFSWTNVLAIEQLAQRLGWSRLTPPGLLTIASYNIHKGHSSGFLGLRRRLVIHEMVPALGSMQADLVFLQEVQGRNDRAALRHAHWPLESQHDLLSNGYHQAVYRPAAHYLHGHHGNALLSQFPILTVQAQDFSDHALEKRSVLHAVVRYGSEALYLFVVHFGLLHQSRLRQLSHLVGWIERAVPVSAPLIVAGDFNDWRRQLPLSAFQALGLEEISGRAIGRTGHRRPDRTFPSFMPILPMDRMFARGFDLVASRRGGGGPRWANLSDHLPLIAQLRRRP
jgi:endonuclease/exonuclease/phosphatase family metal-dependent hydrolase/8-oxo-dGTP pyrophosphatase MutT (NUDIX family)